MADQVQRFINDEDEPAAKQPASEPEKKSSALDSQTAPTQTTSKPHQPTANMDFIKDFVKKIEAKKQAGNYAEKVEPIHLSDIANQ